MKTMKCVILAGGFGTRISEESFARPKPMVEIGGKPLLWHIMKIYSSQGVSQFVILAGYKAEIIKQYFLDFYSFNSDFTVNVKTNQINYHGVGNEDWTVTIIDTGLGTATGGRVKRAEKYIGNDESFFLTYGDGVANVSLDNLLKAHKHGGGDVTLTSVSPGARFGLIKTRRNKVVEFVEKPSDGEGRINGGFFAVKTSVLAEIRDDSCSWELDVLPKLVKRGALNFYPHDGFWQCVDTLRDKKLLDDLWERGKPPWKIW